MFNSMEAWWSPELRSMLELALNSGSSRKRVVVLSKRRLDGCQADQEKMY